jgi:hypothetical protein
MVRLKDVLYYAKIEAVIIKALLSDTKFRILGNSAADYKYFYEIRFANDRGQIVQDEIVIVDESQLS